MNGPVYKFEDHKNIHIIIEASAGTGKTYTIEQILPQMIDAGISIEKIAVLTFTEKAAAELQDRIRKELSKRIVEPNVEKEKKTKLENAIELLPNANIGTIHHFCRSIIKKHSLKLGLSGKFKEIKNASEEIETYFKKFWGRIEKDDSLELIQLLQKIGFQKFKETLINLTEKSGGKRIKLLEKSSSNSNSEYFLKLKTLLDNSNLTLEKAYVEKLKTFYTQDFATPMAMRSALKAAFLTNELKPIINVQKFILSSNSIKEDEYIKILNELNNGLEEEVSIDLFNPVFEYANKLILEFEKFLVAQDLISLDGLILKARDLISDRDIKKEIQKEVQYLILDECQDTNPIQMDLVTKLFEGKNSGIILIGDPKQSIYRFRNADLISYKNAINNLNPKKELILGISYRSSKHLIQAFNLIFPEFESLSKVYQSVEANRVLNEFGKKISPPLLMLGLNENNTPKTQDEEGNEYSAETLRKESMNEIVNLIHSITDNENYLIEDKVSKTENHRKIKFSDIAILANSNASLNTLLKEFSRKSISANIYKSQTFYSHKIVQAVSYLLHAIENPNDSSSLYKALASDLFLVPEGTLFQLSESGELSYLFKTKNLEVYVIFESLRKAHENRYLKDVSFTLQELIKENKILEVISLGFEGKRNLANIYHLLEILSYSQLTENLSFGEVVRKLRKDVGTSVEQEIKLDNDKKDTSFNSVQLMTLHASKGLEFPVCILYDLAASPKADNTSLFIKDNFLKEEELEIELKLKLANEEELTTLGFREERERNSRELINEKERLLYVGFTRAKDYLVIPLHDFKKPKKNSLRGLIGNAFQKEKIENLIRLDLAENFNETKTRQPKEIKNKTTKESNKAAEKIELLTISTKDLYKKAGIKLQSYSSLARELEPEEDSIKEKIMIEKTTVSENESYSPITLSSEKRGTTFGLLCHKVMEIIDLKLLTEENKAEKEVEKLVKEFYPETGLNESKDYSSQDAINICRSTLNKSYIMNEEKTEFSKVKDWKYVTREKSFFYKIKSSKIDYLIGIGDGMFLWNEKYYLLDWKTNLIKSSNAETIDETIQRKVKDSYFYQYMIYSMNLIENIVPNAEDRRDFWEKKFGGMLFIFMRIKEDNQGSLLIKPSFQEILDFRKGLGK